MTVVLALGLGACEPLTGVGQRPEGTRLVRMQVGDDLLQQLGSQVSGLQLVAVVVPSDRFAFYTSLIVDPAISRDLHFYLPIASSPVLLLQSPGGVSTSPGRLLARLLFDDGLGGTRGRLPVGAADLDLGQPASLGDRAPVGLELDPSANPLAVSDLDQDGLVDLLDTDDDGDGSADSDDTDADGDGVEDLLQGYSALADADLNGIPDLFEDGE